MTQELQSALNQILLDVIPKLNEGADIVQTIQQKMIATAWAFGPADPEPMPVWDYRQQLIASTPPGILADFAQQVDKTWESVNWHRNPNYVDDESLGRFREWYGYNLYAGSFGMVKDLEIAVGVIVIAPDCLYPSHNHEAAELYVPISGRAEWWTEGGDWHIVEPGTPIYHRPWLLHGTRTLDEPLLALFGWLGNTSQHATIKR